MLEILGIKGKTARNPGRGSKRNVSYKSREMYTKYAAP
jgi:hypothetical protein